MFQYPITQISKDEWHRKVEATAMFSIPAQDEALPILYEILDLVQNLNTKPIDQVLGKDLRKYFFTEVFPSVCSKIIKSRYFKNEIVLTISNKILMECFSLYLNYLNFLNEYPGLNQLLLTICAADEYYFKTNNQFSYFPSFYEYFKPNQQQTQFFKNLKPQQQIDVIKSEHRNNKIIWSRGKILEVGETFFKVQYLNDWDGTIMKLDANPLLVAPYKTKSKDFQWRIGLKKGDIIDVQDNFGGWYHGTILAVFQQQNAKKVKVTFKVYSQKGNKHDEKGSFYGIADHEETIDVTTPKIMPFQSTCKYPNYEIAKSSFQVDDSNDMEFCEINGQKIYAIPRKRALSELYFQVLNKFGLHQGFQKPLEVFEKEVNFANLCSYIKAIGCVSHYLHKQVVIQLVPRLQKLIEKYLFSNVELVSKEFNKEKSDMLFSGVKSLMKRLYSPDQVGRYESQLKMKLISSCLSSQALKRKLQGLHELKDVVRGISHGVQRTKKIKKWILQEKIFEKVYIQNSHVQLIKKSQDFFKFLINEDILQVKDLEKLYHIAQKGDFQSRISLYKLFKEMSHVFNKEHVNFLIDTILESQVNLILNDDIDLLHELSKFSNYFPQEKVKIFFENLILNQTKNRQLIDYAIKKYAEIVAKGYEMRAYRKQIIKNFLSKISGPDYEKVIKLLKGIFQSVSGKQWGKKDLFELLKEEKIDQLIFEAINTNRQKSDYLKILQQILSFQLFLLKLSPEVKLSLDSLLKSWEMLKETKKQKQMYYEWLCQIMQIGHRIEESVQNGRSLQIFFKQLFYEQKLLELSQKEFELVKNLLVQINKKSSFLTVSNVIKNKEIQKQYNRKVQFKNLKLFSQVQKIMYFCTNKQVSNESFNFYLDVYISRDNSVEEIHQMLVKFSSQFKKFYEQGKLKQAEIALTLIEMVINDSQKYKQISVVPMIKCRRGSLLNVVLFNDISYSFDSIKKDNMFQRKNISLLQLKHKIAQKYKINWKQVKLVGSYELDDYFNSYTLGELNINSETPLTVSRRVVNSAPQQQLIIDDKLSPKAIRVFKKIFFKYATNDFKMDKQDYNRFTAACLGTFAKNYHDKITPIFEKYDSDQDGLLELNDFLTFYTDSAMQKPSIVWANLRHLDVRGNLKFKNEPDDTIPQQELPRYKLYMDDSFYDILFNLLEQKSISKTVFKFLLRLPANKKMNQMLKSIWDQNGEEGRKKLQTFLNETSKFRLLYKLILILNILQYSENSNSLWSVKFSINNGYEVPYKYLADLCHKKNPYSEIQLEIIELGFQIIKEFVYNAFGDKKSAESSALFEQDFSLDDKMQYLMTGVWPKSYGFAKSQCSFAFRYTWRESKLQITEMFLNLVLKIKRQNLQSEQSTVKTLQQSICSKLLSVLSCLMVNEEQKKCLPLYQIHFNTEQAPRQMQEFYTFILCLCFYTQTKEQSVHIHELFKYIKSKNITSAHFRILAMLVSKFGFKEENLAEIPDILLKNILEEQNQPTIEGCARLLCNFEIAQLKTITVEHVDKIFNRCLFGQSSVCKSQQSRKQIYELLVKFCQANQKVASCVILKTKEIIQQNLSKIKITYSTQVNKRSSYGYAGLKNLGNICYMNSMVQQLFMNKQFRYLLLRINDNKEPQWALDIRGNQVDDNFLHQIQRIFGYLEKTTRQDFVPLAFCAAYKPFGESVDIMIQQDVQEFVSMFFDRLEAGIKEHPLRNLVQNFYTGKTANLFKCHNCSQTKKVEQNFHSISLQVKSSKNLQESFNRYILGQLINDYKCDFCQQKADVSKMTRIAKIPQVLIIHLQRIVFNLDTFINEKITSKHEFPTDFNLYPYTLDYLNRQDNKTQHPETLEEYQYELTGIIVHIGNAESGHYISYIKTQENKWLQFNDSIVSSFTAMNIGDECFGGNSSTFDDQFDWDKKQNSKSAYLLIYNRKFQPHIELCLQKNNNNDKIKILEQLKLQQLSQPKNQTNISTSKVSQPTQSQQQSSSVFQDSQQERQKQRLKQEQEIREFKQIKNENSQEIKKYDFDKDKNCENNGETCEVILLNDKIQPFMLQELEKQIEQDNRVHFFQTSLASEAFSEFFARLMEVANTDGSLVELCKKLTFGFWLKSKTFKTLLRSLQNYLKQNPVSFEDLILTNESLKNLLIQNSNVDIRDNIACFLANVFIHTVKSAQIKEKDNQKNQNCQKIEKQIKIINYLDELFEILPTTVTKCWTKFSQYFEFWYLLAQSKVFMEYLVQRQILKHFIDYFLDKKSPLKIYSVKKVQQIGSTYANPDFTMLLKCVSTLLFEYFDANSNFSLTQEDTEVLLNFQFLQKLISEGYSEIAALLAKQTCPKNLKASQKFAVVLLKGFSKATYQNIQKYIDVMNEYVTIEDQDQKVRMEWVLGKQTLNVSPRSKILLALNAYNMEQRLHYFDSSLHIEQGASFLQPIYQLNRRVENFCIISVNGILRICEKSKPVRDYVFGLGAPCLMYGRYVDFYEEFINRYIEQARQSYYSTATYFDKAQFGTEVKSLYEKLIKLRKSQYNQVQQEKQFEPVSEQLQTKQKQDSQQKSQNAQKGGQEDTQFKMQFSDNSFQGREQEKDTGKKSEVRLQIQPDDPPAPSQSVKNEKISDIEETKADQKPKPSEQIEFQEVNFKQTNQKSNQPEITEDKPQHNNNFINQQNEMLKLYNYQFDDNIYYAAGFNIDEGSCSNKNNSRRSQSSCKGNISDEFEDFAEQKVDDKQNKKNQQFLYQYQEQEQNSQVLQKDRSNKRKKGCYGEANQEQNQELKLSSKDKLPQDIVNQGYQNESSDWEENIYQTKKSNEKNLINNDYGGYEQNEMREINFSQEQNSNQERQHLIKKKSEKNQNYFEQDTDHDDQSKQVYHPVIFNFCPVETIRGIEGLYGVQYTYHESEVVYVKTLPTSKGNRAFKSSYGRDRMINKLNQTVWNSKRVKKIKGYFVSNLGSKYLRVKTENGCDLVKPNDSIWIWGEVLVKMWKCQRCNDWPEWSMYE